MAIIKNSAHNQERFMIDAIREMLGYEPLYQAKKSHHYLSKQMLNSMGSGNSKTPVGGSSY